LVSSVCVWRAAFVLVSWNFQQVLLKYDITQAGCSRKKNEEKNTAKIFVWIFGNGAPFPVRVDG